MIKIIFKSIYKKSHVINKQNISMLLKKKKKKRISMLMLKINYFGNVVF